MSRLTLFLSVIILFLSACSPKNSARIKGRLGGLGKEKIYLEKVNLNGSTVVDSCVTSRKGEFKFRVMLGSNNPTFFNITYKNQLIPLLIGNNEELSVRSVGNLATSYEVEGSVGSELIRSLNRDMSATLNYLDSIRTNYMSATSDSVRSALLQDYTQNAIKIKRNYIRFVITNSTSLAAIYALYQKMPSGVSMFSEFSDAVYYRLVADSLKNYYPNSPHVINLVKDIERIENLTQISNMFERSGLQESNYPDLELPDMFGNNMRLSLVNNQKVVLLDYWLSTDINCKMRNNELRDIYHKYKDRGFEIYQVAIDRSKADWVNTVQNQRLPWISVCDLRGENSPAVRLYGVTKIPANYLINAQGEIVAKNVFGDRLEAKLAEIMK